MPSICEIHVSLATYMLEVACACCCCCSINLLASSSLIVVVVDAVAAVAAAIKSARISVGRQEEINI